MNINELKSKNLNQLVQIGGELGVADATDMRKEDLVERILQGQIERSGQVYATGILDIVDDGYGFLRRRGLLGLAPQRTRRCRVVQVGDCRDYITPVGASGRSSCGGWPRSRPCRRTRRQPCAPSPNRRGRP